MFNPSSKKYFTDRSKALLFCGSLLLVMFCVCHAFLSFRCSLVGTCWERAYRLARLYMKFSCVLLIFNVVPGSGVVLGCIDS